MNSLSTAITDGVKKLDIGRLMLAEGDLEGVHLMRTAARRMRTAARILGRRDLESELKEFMGALSRVRDLDVFRQAIQAAELAPADRADLLAIATRALDGAVPGMKELVEGPAYDQLVEHLSLAAHAVPARTSGAERVFKSLDRVLTSRPQEWEAATDEQLHDLRKNVKRLRYSLEAFQPEYGRPVERMIERCRELQEALGAVQDAAAFETLLRETRTFGAGQFLATVRGKAAGSRQRLDDLWRRAFGEKTLSRLGAHLLRRAARGSRPAPRELRAVS